MNAPHRLPAAWRPPLHDEYVCWSRMQTEAGQGLQSIIARKELERRAGDGVFFWGVGNAPPALANVLAKAAVPVAVIFSVMKSRPKAVDIAPSQVVAWRRYIDEHGVERELPRFALVTSRADSPSGRKRTHYALICYSADPLKLQAHPPPFDPSAFRNAGGTGAPVGNSQVTALLKRVSDEDRPSDYAINFQAQLAGGYWVRLTDPVLVDASKAQMVDRSNRAALSEWLDLVGSVRSGPKADFHDRGAELLL